ncbi:MAG: glycosyltransferase [Candidatus Doudnabacteria bacterium]|nr:glycosyltransferase [Candidatus Doudnabacteria bacterium]
MNVALAHDSLTQLGGAERVLDALHEVYPDSPVFVLVMDKKLKQKYQAWDIRTSWLQVIYNFLPKLQYLLPLIPLAVSSLDFSGYDVVISSSSGFIKNIKTPKNSIHINYCHTPTRFLWSEPEYVDQEVPKILRPLAKLFLAWMKKWDFKGAQRVNYFLANSKEVQKRITQYYKRGSEVIYPFVDTAFWKPSKWRHSEGLQPTEESQNGNPTNLVQNAAAGKSNYFLLAGRLQAHKMNELIINIFNKLKLPLHVVGTGRQEEYLKSIAGPNITFLGRVTDEQLRSEYSSALAFIYPQVEDFGLMPLEAAACGTATIAYGKGGALETVMQNATGEFFYSYNPEEISKLIISFNPEKYSQEVFRRQAEKFSKDKFKSEIVNFINSLNL